MMGLDYCNDAGADLLRWMVLLVLGILIVMLFTHLIRWIMGPGSSSGLSMWICLGVDFMLYLILGMWVAPHRTLIWKVVWYVFMFELFTQGILAPYLPAYFAATPGKSLMDVVLCIAGFVLGMFLQVRAIKRGIQIVKECRGEIPCGSCQ